MSAGLGGSGPLGISQRLSTPLPNQRGRFQRVFLDDHRSQAAVVGDRKDLVQRRATQVGVYQDHAPFALRHG